MISFNSQNPDNVVLNKPRKENKYSSSASEADYAAGNKGHEIKFSVLGQGYLCLPNQWPTMILDSLFPKRLLNRSGY